MPKSVRPVVQVHPEELCIELLYLAGDLKGVSPGAAELVALAAGQLEAELRGPGQGASRHPSQPVGTLAASGCTPRREVAAARVTRGPRD